MQIYPIRPGFSVGESFDLAVQPGTRFSLAIYAQRHDENLISAAGVALHPGGAVSAELRNGKYVFTAPGRVAPARHDADWNWPTVTIKPNTPSLDSGAYVVIAYEVGANGEPLTELGKRAAAHKPIFAGPPDSDSMALVIARPRKPSAAIAYIVPVNTYHAYNSTGGGCYYGDPIHRTQPRTQVTLRRPGGGLGAQLGEPADPYDPCSPRQQFTHWDAKFIRWLHAEGIACDFYTDLDLHHGTELKLEDYRCMLSVGHHEYWSQEMRDYVSRFIAQGGNLAIFSGNTCYRPIDYADDYTSMIRLAEQWPDHDESNLIGLSYGYGGGKYGVWKRLRGGWIRRDREAIGFTVRQAEHWVFSGTSLRDGQTFGAKDRLVGYEVDGVPPVSNGFVTLADTVRLEGWDIGGAGAMGVYQPHADGGLVFNGGTTDWARVLIDPNAQSRVVVDQITRNVVRRFIGLPPHCIAREDTVLIEAMTPPIEPDEALPDSAAV
ncbi:N,N-dimethylformamidase beta subunit family domain-containing protein [Caballeronia sp. BR00000012568055]|uniref:N,N-dimethylformamidase beta subunit family domain-containing protein n=1 Tax=Caballeronia sp. BR00000012568055 TaxID=2918761 RepID=UPI0023F7FBC8|nr:N,N-dimethylformamidase beta subunit family domain-containing protein [Caballeronia sp. BR00000012568055]